MNITISNKQSILSCSSCEPAPISPLTIVSNLSFRDKFEAGMLWCIFGFIIVEISELIIQKDTILKNTNIRLERIDNTTVSQ